MKCFLTILVLQCCLAELLENNTLLLVHVVMRHCQRTPSIEELYPTSPHINESIYAPYGYGQLTNEGKRHCYSIGTSLRQRYQDFLTAAYHYSIVEAISSSYTRTKETLQLVLAGLFPPTEDLIWSTELNWIPVAYYYTEKKEDLVMLPYLTDWFKDELDKFEKSEEGKNRTAHFNERMEYIQQYTGIEDIDFRKAAFISYGMETQVNFGLELPDWMKSIYPSNLYNEYLVHQFSTKRLRRIACGYLLKKIVDETEMKINGTSEKQILIYSGHDVTVMTLLVILDVWDGKPPPIGSYCTIEVHNINGTYGLKFYYFNNTSMEPFTIEIPGYGEFLPLEEIKKQKQEYLHLDDLKRSSSSARNSVEKVMFLLTIFLNLRIQLLGL